MRELAKVSIMFSLVGIGGSTDGFWSVANSRVNGLNCDTGIASGNGDDIEDAKSGNGDDVEDADVSTPYGQPSQCGRHSGHEHLDALHSSRCSIVIAGRSGSSGAGPMHNGHSS